MDTWRAVTIGVMVGLLAGLWVGRLPVGAAPAARAAQGIEISRTRLSKARAYYQPGDWRTTMERLRSEWWYAVWCVQLVREAEGAPAPLIPPVDDSEIRLLLDEAREAARTPEQQAETADFAAIIEIWSGARTAYPD